MADLGYLVVMAGGFGVCALILKAIASNGVSK
jgi:hypothetical protein